MELRVVDAVKTLKSARRVGSQEWRAYWHERPLDDNCVLYESFAGNGVLCNPEAIFRALVDDPEFAHLTHVWSLSPQMWSSGIRAEFAQHPRVRRIPLIASPARPDGSAGVPRASRWSPPAASCRSRVT